MCGVHVVHRELGVGVGNAVCHLFCQDVPAGDWLDALGEPATALAFATRQLVRHGLGQAGWEPDAEAGAECLVVGQAAGEVALHDHRGAFGQEAPDLISRGEQRGQVEAHPGLGVSTPVHFAAQRLVEERHSGDQYSAAGLCEHRSDGRLSGTAEPFEALEQWTLRHGRTPHLAPRA